MQVAVPTSVDLILGITAIIALGAASYTDLKQREVPDWISYGLLIAAFAIRILFSFSESWNLLWSGLLGFAVCFCLASLLYYTNQWGGGDSKLLMAMGAIIGLTFPFEKQSFLLPLFIVLLLVVGAVYGMFWIIGLALAKKKEFFPEFRKTLAEHKTAHFFLLGITLLLVVGTMFVPSLVVFAFFPAGVFYLLLFTTAVEDHCFYRKIPIPQLTEGDWLAESVKLSPTRTLEPRTIDRQDLWELRAVAGKGKIHSVLVKEGVPFIPSFFLAFVAFQLLTRIPFSWLPNWSL